MKEFLYLHLFALMKWIVQSFTPRRCDHRMTVSVRHSQIQGRVDLGHKNLSKDGSEADFYVLTS